MSATTEINTPHDAFVKRMMGNLTVAKSFFRHNLSAKERAAVDLNTIRACPSTVIDDANRSHHIDILYRANINHRPGYLYLLIEHKSGVERWLPLQLLRYISRIWEDHADKFAEQDLPVIIPKVIYHGDKPHPNVVSLFGLIDDPDKLMLQYLRKGFPLVNVVTAPDSELVKQQLSGMVQLGLKHRMVEGLCLEAVIKLILSLNNTENASNFESLRKTVLRYVINRERCDPDMFKRVMAGLSPEQGEIFMNFTEYYTHQGRTEGRTEGRLELAKALVEKGLDIGVIAETVDMSVEALKQLVDGKQVQAPCEA